MACPTFSQFMDTTLLETLERTEIIEISSLGWRPRAHPIYHARSFHICVAYSIVNDLLWVHFECVASNRKQVRQNVPNYRQDKKRGQPFLVAALFLKPVCYSKTVRSPRAHHDSCASAYLWVRSRIGERVSRSFILNYFPKKFKLFNELFTFEIPSSLHTELAEEEGIQPSVALADSRQFSRLVTFATRPLLHTLGAPPRT